jgi:glucose-6-phosphate 1-dehydrogenase
MKNQNYKPCDLVIYGALGDLSKRKLLISLYRLEKSNLLETDTRIIGVDRLDETSPGFIEIAHKSLIAHLNTPIDEEIWGRLSNRLSYLKIDLTQPEQYLQLNHAVDPEQRVMVNYFAVAPFLFKII